VLGSRKKKRHSGDGSLSDDLGRNKMNTKKTARKKKTASKKTEKKKQKIGMPKKTSTVKKKSPLKLSADAHPSPTSTNKTTRSKSDSVLDMETIAPLSVEEITSYIPEIVEDDSAPLVERTGKELAPAISQKSLAVKDPMAAYLREVRRYKVLTPDQERQIALQYAETGDKKFAEILVTSNLRFVVKIAAEYARFGARMIDLVQEGNMGLLHAVKVYNPYKGVRLITYAVWWIRGYIQEYLMKQYSMVKIGTTQNQRKLFYQLQKERKMLEQLGEPGDFKAVAESLGVSEKDVEMMSQRLSGRDVSLNATFDDGGGAMMDFQTDESQLPVDDELAHQEQLEILRKNIDAIQDDLNEREKYLLTHRLLSDSPLTLQEIGDRYGITREAARQMEARLISKIRKEYS
jgi:RNA polymerase sigma-32 factor